MLETLLILEESRQKGLDSMPQREITSQIYYRNPKTKESDIEYYDWYVRRNVARLKRSDLVIETGIERRIGSWGRPRKLVRLTPHLLES